MGDRVTGPLGVDPLHYVCVVFGLLICWVGYLLLPKGMRQQHFNAYPKRFRWSARPRTKRGYANGSAGKGQVSSMAATGNTFLPSQLFSRQGWLVGRFPSFLFFVFQFKNWRIVIVLFSYSHFILAISQTVQTTIINNRHLVAHRKAITEICLRRALEVAQLLPRLEDMARSNINHHRPAVDNNSSSWAAAVRASKTMRSSCRLPCSSFASRAF